MEIQTDAETLEHIWQALNDTPRRPRLNWAEQKFRESLEKGWIFSSDIEDILIALDSRLDSYQLRYHTYCELFEIRFEEIYYKPRKISTGAMSFEGLRPEYFVLLLINIECLGFTVDAQRFVQILLPTIAQRTRTILSVAELEIYWYERSRLKSDILFYTDPSKRYGETSLDRRSATGFKMSYYQDEGEAPHLLRIRGPKYRERRRPTSVTCPDCGYEWQKGDTESSLLHRREHKKRMSWLDPKPHPLMLAELGASGLSAELVTCGSPEWKHTEMYVRARAFKRELHYDFIQWKSKGDREDPDVHGFLFTDELGRIVGACAFRNRADDPGLKKWGLQWIWICPKERREGHLAKRWAGYREQFGDFYVEPPVSDAMQAFLASRGDSGLMSFHP